MEVNSTDLFAGFAHPKDGNYTCIPNGFIEHELSKIDNMAELKVVLYAMRHTWGYQEYGMWKRISVDEFAHGRKRKNGERMDSGTGLGITATKAGIKRAVEHGYLMAGFDRSDLARIQKYYYLRMQQEQAETA